MFKATLKNVPISAQKMRLVGDMVRGKSVSEAVSCLSFSNKKAAFILKKLCSSVVANAEFSGIQSSDNLIVVKLLVDKASSLKRVFPRAKGRADRIEKQRCHILIEVR
jgi:large subunit ribosomal protein L22